MKRALQRNIDAARLSSYYPFVKNILKAAEMREVDRLTTEQFAIPSLLLMESAATAAAEQIQKLFAGTLQRKKILVVCGPGNNGGDGAAVARRLLLAGADVSLALLVPISKTRGNARVNFEIVRRLGETRSKENGLCGSLTYLQWTDSRRISAFGDEIEHQDVIVDAIFGTGVTRPLEGVFLDAVKAINWCRTRRKTQNATPFIVSLDLPSGLNSDSGATIGEAVQADLTVTFTSPKPANVLPAASNLGGRLVVAPIGSPDKLIQEQSSGLYLVEREDAASWLKRTRYSPGSYKNSHGHALIIAGSRHMPGAAVLSSDAAMCAGAGLVTVATSSSAMPAVTPRLMPEIMCESLEETETGAASAESIGQIRTLLSRMTVCALGPGMSAEEDSTRRLIRQIVETRGLPLVIDADGLNSLAPWPPDLHGTPEAPLILTPHPGEMLRLIGTKEKAVLTDRVAAAREFAKEKQVILVLKGERTLIADPEGNVYVNPTGNPGLGTAGAGDTLTGLITGFLAQEFGLFGAQANALDATLAAVYVGGLAGDIAAQRFGKRTMVASTVRECLSEAVTELDPEGERP